MMRVQSGRASARVTPINMAEAIIEPFWDPQLSGLREWRVVPGARHGLSVTQNWCWVKFEWARAPARGPALRMSRRFEVEVAAYDALVLSIMAPQGAVVVVRAETENGTFEGRSAPAGAVKLEMAVPLQRARRLRGVALEVWASDPGIATGWLNWIGLQNRRQLRRYETEWQRFDARWEGYLLPETHRPAFRPQMGLLVDDRELGAIHRAHEAHVRRHGTSPLVEAGREAARHVPERMIGEFVNFWEDTRYCRTRDIGKVLLRRGPNAAVAGLLLRDARLLRLAARYALSIAMCGRWDDGFICRFPAGVFEHRCFVQSLCTYETALVLDLAGELFTPLGRDLIRRRIAEEGLGAIAFNTWKHEYIFACNQLAWFSPGRMAGLAALKGSWPRVGPYMELAYGELCESLDRTVLPDGGYVEGPTYFRCVGRDGGLAALLYARATGRTLAEATPAALRRTAPFGAAVESTVADADVIPVCDAMSRCEDELLALMARTLPRSRWTAMYRKAQARSAGASTTLVGWAADRIVPRRIPRAPSLVVLPDMGLASWRGRVAGDEAKLLVMGNRSGAGHTHEDKGSFVLEFAGEALAVDPGTCDYSSPFAGLYKNCERHNMLVPYGTPERPHPAVPIPADIRVAAAEARGGFMAEVELSPGWESYYRRWRRTLELDRSGRLTVRDEYDLERGEGVEFYWNTRLPVALVGGSALIRGARGTAEITVPAGGILRLDRLPLFGGQLQNRIAIVCAGPRGTLEVAAKLRRA